MVFNMATGVVLAPPLSPAPRFHLGPARQKHPPCERALVLSLSYSVSPPTRSSLETKVL